jgi:uncharacterized membrane protein YfcA
VPLWLAFVVAYALTVVMSPAGVSGAFLLLPFQVSVLGSGGPAATATNHLFNVVAIPSAVYRYIREGRMLWPLALVIVIGTIPGSIAGALARIRWLSDAGAFEMFMGLVLLLIGGNLVARILSRGRGVPGSPRAGAGFRLRVQRFDLLRLEYVFEEQLYSLSVPGLASITAVIGAVGGAYGIGGGAIISPILVALYRLPVHTIAGSTLLGTWVTSLVAVGFFAAAAVAPDWRLGLAFGAGGLLGMYTGARLQRFLPARSIESVLALVICGLALRYLFG